QRTNERETSEIARTSPAAAFAQRQRRDANDANVLPALAARKLERRIVVTAIARDHRHFMPARGQLRGQIREVLGRGNHIGIKALIEKQKLQTGGIVRRLRKCSTVFSRPSRKEIVGFQPNNSCARVMLGCRCFGSSAGNGRYLNPELAPQIAITSSASCLIVNSSGLPRFTGSCKSSA